MDELLLKSKEIYEEALATYKPKAIVMMLSGGDDSTACYGVAREIGIPIDAVIHGHTGTGIKEAFDFAREHGMMYGHRFLVADAKNSYADYVLRKGFLASATLPTITLTMYLRLPTSEP